MLFPALQRAQQNGCQADHVKFPPNRNEAGYPLPELLKSGWSAGNTKDMSSEAPYIASHGAIKHQVLDRFFLRAEGTVLVPMPIPFDKVVFSENCIFLINHIQIFIFRGILSFQNFML